MQAPFKTSLFIFRRDLRLDDNTALIAACEQSDKVLPCFIFDEQQVTQKNAYRSMNAILFMIQSLKDLAQQFEKRNGKLYLFYGKTIDIIEKLITTAHINAVFTNKDYTPFSQERDKKIEDLCNKNGVEFVSYADILLNEPADVRSLKETPYFIFTPFFKRACLIEVRKPIAFDMNNFFGKPIAFAAKNEVYTQVLDGYQNDRLPTQGGTTHGVAILNELPAFKNYQNERNYPSMHTTKMGAHLKFGTISIRLAYYAIKKTLGLAHPLIRQIYWRDFLTHTAYHIPSMFGHALQEKYDNLTWQNDPDLFKKWCTGTTGFPIVDAGMRQMNTIGFMHNRVRMIVASFLVKDLHIDWRAGEQYFAQQLTDYDPSVNNGNWQWSASTGIDAQPYFRIFNPWLQQKKFDSECLYIKEWIPEFKNVSPKIIHNWYKSTSPKIDRYPRPCVDHNKESQLAKMQFKMQSKK